MGEDESTIVPKDKKQFIWDIAKAVIILVGISGLAAMLLGYNFNTCVYLTTGMKVCWMAAKHALTKT
ncbi:hypothetical protein Pmani_011848 [Petrolisthes manimaculis]|uniref:Uncharacterized protein n=1 Tax=Petrolisthes manimaculis TaxID=1843537 RepID=A0AAE1PZV8_9EUCA|nr:hypothetical protein Pmani_011848 [Petrolisthes manimaculis]